MTYYAYMNSPRRHTAPSTNRGYNRAVGVLTQSDYKLVAEYLEFVLSDVQAKGLHGHVDNLKALLWRVEQTGRLTR